MVEHLPAVDVWLLVPLSLGRYRQLSDAKLDFRSAFVESETAYVYRAQIPQSQQEPSIDLISAAGLTDDILPAAGEGIQRGQSFFGAMVARLVSVRKFDEHQPLLDVRLSSQRSRTSQFHAK